MSWFECAKLPLKPVVFADQPPAYLGGSVGDISPFELQFLEARNEGVTLFRGLQKIKFHQDSCSHENLSRSSTSCFEMSTRSARTKLLRCNVFDSIRMFDAIVVPRIRCNRLPHVRPRLVFSPSPPPRAYLCSEWGRANVVVFPRRCFELRERELKTI